MTVVNPKSISGINSITTGSGSDDILTIHNNNGTERLRIDSTGTTKITTGIVTTLTATSSAKVGSGITLSPDGDLFVTGVCTATSFVGSGANLTGISGVSVANQSDNRLITATGTTDALNGESGATYDGTDFTIGSGRISLTDESSGSQFRLGAGNDFQIEHDGSNSYIYNLTNDLVIQCDANVKITAKSGGTQRFRFDTDGLKFGTDTAAANALGDYEEGTFTATCDNSVTLHSGGDLLSYTKIGRLVTVRGQLAINSSNGGSDLTINNLPFVNENTNEDSDATVGAVRLWDINVTSGCVDVICFINSNDSKLQFWENRDNGSADRLNASGNGYVAVTITYQTSS